MSHPILLYDGGCGLCNRFVQFILRRDRNAVFRFASLQSALAAPILICPGSVATEFSGRGPKDPTKVLTADDVAHAVAMVVTQGPQSFLSEIHVRPLRKA